MSGRPDVRVCVVMGLLILCASACVAIQSQNSGMVMMLVLSVALRGENV